MNGTKKGRRRRRDACKRTAITVTTCVGEECAV
jgi:hypothetical protein